VNWHAKPWRVSSGGCNVDGNKTLSFDDLAKTIEIHPGAVLWGTYVYTGAHTAEATTTDGLAHTIECNSGSPRILQCYHVDDGQTHPGEDGPDDPLHASWTAVEGLACVRT